MKALLLLLALSVVGCTKLSSHFGTGNVSTSDLNSPMTDPLKKAIVTFRMGQPIAELEQSSPVKLSKDCLRAAKACFYSFDRPFATHDLPTTDLPTVRIGTGRRSIDLENVVGFLAPIDGAKKPTMENVSITLQGLPSDVPHDDNRLLIYKLIGQFNQAGWKRYLHNGTPRVSGSEAGKFLDTQARFGIFEDFGHPWFDPTYVMSLDQWMKIRSGFYNWFFQIDGIYLNIQAQRLNSKEFPKLRGSYLITLNFQTEEDFYGAYDQKQGSNWRELLPDIRAKSQKERAVYETALRAAGIKIDESYQDPPIQSFAAPR